MKVSKHTPLERGQAAVESAIILPVMIFMILGIIQLTMMQQAALMTEYAAFQACRAGIVWNGNNDKMVSAAEVALAPTIGQSRLYPAAATKIRGGNEGLLDLTRDLAALAGAQLLPGGMKPIRVDVVNPNTAVFNANVAKGQVIDNDDELVFDDVGYTSTDGNSGFAGDEPYRQALQLTIRLRYFYELRVPFANWIIQACFFASRAPNVMLSGMLGGEELSYTTGGVTANHKTAVQTGDHETAAAAAAALAEPIDNPSGKPTLTRAEFFELYGLRRLGIYLVPLTATYTMRMQSNFYRQNLTN